jgi:hypothetical protein
VGVAEVAEEGENRSDGTLEAVGDCGRGGRANGRWRWRWRWADSHTRRIGASNEQSTIEKPSATFYSLRAVFCPLIWAENKRKTRPPRHHACCQPVPSFSTSCLWHRALELVACSRPLVLSLVFVFSALSPCLRFTTLSFGAFPPSSSACYPLNLPDPLGPGMSHFAPFLELFPPSSLHALSRLFVSRLSAS